MSSKTHVGNAIPDTKFPSKVITTIVYFLQESKKVLSKLNTSLCLFY